MAVQAAGHANIAIVVRRTVDAALLVPALMRHDVDAQPILDEQARYKGGVVILPMHLAKGLEFDAATEFETRLLYVSLSRGVHALAVVAPSALHPLLDYHRQLEGITKRAAMNNTRWLVPLFATLLADTGRSVAGAAA
ncbi:hypothetical protein [Deinococcus ruber]|uniref:DNA helicase n=1 Tax=Deinococcus ruber TaxID=1848197 RepID=A0A918FFZ4_9DEIO|nr:hypothetical protein [Deinococcus ruber]GGR35484.1 hypothetical protein GCM10008957_51780 [Deinococcus ruber]